LLGKFIAIWGEIMICYIFDCRMMIFLHIGHELAG